jgi:hypothetical protein
MCYSAESSGGTFLFVCAIALLLTVQGKTAIALILVVLASMQVLEYVIWTQTPVCTPANYVASSLIPLLLALQPTLIALILWISKEAGSASQHIYRALFYFSAVAVVAVLGYMAMYPRPSCVTPVKGHLNWDLEDRFFIPFQVFYHIVMSALVLTIRPPLLGIGLFSVYAGSWVYYTLNYPETWSSLWCHGINAGAVLALFA